MGTELSTLEKDILEWRDTKVSLQEIRKRLNLTGERIRQIEAKARRKLRDKERKESQGNG